MNLDKNEKIFFTLIENEKRGPFSLNDFKEAKLKSDTLIWYYKLSEWKKLSEIEELNEELKFFIQPPNIDYQNKDTVESFSGVEEKDIIKENELRPKEIDTKKKIIFSKREIQFFIGWVAFHLIALLTSYGEVPGFNERGWYSAKIIWPFNSEWFWCDQNGASLLYFSGDCGSNGGIEKFNGIFTGYDITDFLLYIGLSLFIMIFLYISRKIK